MIERVSVNLDVNTVQSQTAVRTTDREGENPGILCDLRFIAPILMKLPADICLNYLSSRYVQID